MYLELLRIAEMGSLGIAEMKGLGNVHGMGCTRIAEMGSLGIAIIEREH